MSLSEIYKRSVIYPGLMIILLTAIILFIENQDYQSEWLTRQAVIEMGIVTVFLYSLLICILSLTLFLNNYDRIRKNKFLSALCWFLIPGGFICTVIGKAFNEYLTVDTNEMVYALIFNLPFITGLLWGYYKFRNQNKESFIEHSEGK